MLGTIGDGCQIAMAGQSEGSEFLKEQVGLEDMFLVKKFGIIDATYPAFNNSKPLPP